MRPIIVPLRPAPSRQLGPFVTDVLHDYVLPNCRRADRLSPAHSEKIFAILETLSSWLIFAPKVCDPSQAAYER